MPAAESSTPEPVSLNHPDGATGCVWVAGFQQRRMRQKRPAIRRAKDARERIRKNAPTELPAKAICLMSAHAIKPAAQPTIIGIVDDSMI